MDPVDVYAAGNLAAVGVRAVPGHVVATGQLIGLYESPDLLTERTVDREGYLASFWNQISYLRAGVEGVG